jgi:hypothetical protein
MENDYMIKSLQQTQQKAQNRIKKISGYERKEQRDDFKLQTWYIQKCSSTGLRNSAKLSSKY